MSDRSIETIVHDLAIASRNSALDAASKVAKLYGAPEEACQRILMLKGKLAVVAESPLTPKPAGHYGEMCMNPSICAGKGYCPRDPNCAD